MSPSIEVACATDIGMRDRRPVRGGFGPFAINIVLEDGVDGGVRACADLECAGAGGFKPVGAVGPGKPDNADTGTKSLFGMAAFAHDDFDERCRIASDLTGVALEAFRRPVGVTPVRTRHVFAHCRVQAVR